MTENHVQEAFVYCICHKDARDEIRAGMMPPLLHTLLPEPRDRDGVMDAIQKVNKEYITIGPQNATESQRDMLFEHFKQYIREFIDKTYHS